MLEITSDENHKKSREVLATKYVKEKAKETKSTSNLEFHTGGHKLNISIGQVKKEETFSVESMMKLQTENNFSDRKIM